jgi:hypothetical protein
MLEYMSNRRDSKSHVALMPLCQIGIGSNAELESQEKCKKGAVSSESGQLQVLEVHQIPQLLWKLSSDHVSPQLPAMRTT